MSVLKLGKRGAGFTIVELLVVIVVIGVLGSVATVTYNGSQTRARNAARLATVEKIEETIQVVLTKKTPLEVRASLNLSDYWYRACVGTGHADVNNNGQGDCAYYGNSPYVSVSNNFNALLKTYSGLPDVSNYPKVTATDGDVVTSPYFGSAWVDNKDMLVLEYTLEGQGQKCKFSPLVYRSGGGDSLTPASGASPDYSKSEYGVTECFLVVTKDF